jgi:hypothetical protein
MFELKIYKKDSSKPKEPPKKTFFGIDIEPEKDKLPPVDKHEHCDHNEEYSFVLFYELNVGESKLWIDAIHEK